MTTYCKVCGQSHHPLERLEAIAAACLNGIFAAMTWLTHA